MKDIINTRIKVQRFTNQIIEFIPWHYVHTQKEYRGLKSYNSQQDTKKLRDRKWG